MTRETFNQDFVTGLKTNLEAAPASTSKLSKADVLRELAPTLKMLRDERGYTLEALVDLLKAKGLDVKVSTIQAALKKKGVAKKAKATPPPSPQIATPPVANPEPVSLSRARTR